MSTRASASLKDPAAAAARGSRASYNLITDRTPEILSGVDTLESVTFSASSRLTNAGVATLARLPRLKEVDLGGMPGVTSDVGKAFPGTVQVKDNP